MSACGCESPETPPVAVHVDHQPRPWWRDIGVLLPILSGIALLTGWVLEWTGHSTAALVTFWIGLLGGGYTFAPGAFRRLFTKGKLGIGLLMTISAIGAVILGYVESAAALAFLYSIAETLEDKAMERARGGLRALLKLVPETATVLREGEPFEIPAAELRSGDLLVVSPGERVATDGVVRSGHSSLDTSAITGESIPVEVSPGDAIAAGSINSSGVLTVEASASGSDNSLTTIVKLVEQAQAEKGERARIADRIARPLVPGVMVLAVLVGVVGSLLGDPELWITRALVVLVAASPCAMAIAVPVTVVSGLGAASKFGVVLKSGAAFEELGRIKHLAVDKTGTLTRNEPTVTAVISTGARPEAEILELAAALEQHSTHPLAAAITAATDEVPTAQTVTEQAGRGLSGTADGHRVQVGSPRWLDAGPLTEQVHQWEADGQTCVLVTVDGRIGGAIAVRDELRPEAAEAITALRAQGIEISMLTGDNERTARALARLAGIDDVHAELRPEQKARLVTGFARHHPTAMIGDGINDAPALAGATVGIAMGATGSDAAIESADVAFTGHDLRLIPLAMEHSKRGRSIINQNILLSLAIIVILPPLAITGVLGLASIVLIHEIGEVVVIAGLRAARTRHLLARRPTAIPDRDADPVPVG